MSFAHAGEAGVLVDEGGAEESLPWRSAKDEIYGYETVCAEAEVEGPDNHP